MPSAAPSSTFVLDNGGGMLKVNLMLELFFYLCVCLLVDFFVCLMNR